MKAGCEGLVMGVMRTEGEGPRGSGKGGRASGGEGRVRKALRWDLVREVEYEGVDR